MQAIDASGAERVIVTHGQVPIMVRWLQQKGLEAGAFETEYGTEEARDEAPPGTAPANPAADDEQPVIATNTDA